jgi:hypothetical protein
VMPTACVTLALDKLTINHYISSFHSSNNTSSSSIS